MRGLYLITNDDPIEQLLKKLDVALATGHIKILQYRRKKIALVEQPNEVEQIKKICDAYQVPLVINDNLQLAQEFGVGVHLGQSDGEIAIAKKVLPKGRIIGCSCMDEIELAEKAIADGATYVAFGAIYQTQTKPEAGNHGIQTLKVAKNTLNIPLCAIGGLTVENVQPVIEAGADLCAVISDVLGRSVDTIPARVEAWAKQFEMQK